MAKSFREKSWDELAAAAQQANSQGDLIEAIRRLKSSATWLTWVLIILAAVMAAPVIREIFNFFFSPQ